MLTLLQSTISSNLICLQERLDLLVCDARVVQMLLPPPKRIRHGTWLLGLERLLRQLPPKDSTATIKALGCTMAVLVCFRLLPIHELCDVLDRFIIPGPSVSNAHMLRSELVLTILSSYVERIRAGTQQLPPACAAPVCSGPRIAMMTWPPHHTNFPHIHQ